MSERLLADVAARIADVSPAWREVVSADVQAAPFADCASLASGVALGIELIREGWLLHRDRSRVAPNAAPDLALLVGDWCYAAGLREVIEHGTLDQVAVLAELVADVSARSAASDGELDARWATALDAL